MIFCECVCLWCLCVCECVIFKLIGRFYVYLFKSQSEAVKMKKHGKHYCLQFLFLISKLWIEICKTITFGYKSQKGQKASFEFNVVVDIFSFKISKSQIKVCCVVYICLKLMQPQL